MVEHNLAKVGVASSSLVSRSNSRENEKTINTSFSLSVFNALQIRRGGRVVMQRPAKPWTPVRFRPPPPEQTELLYARMVELVGRSEESEL